MLIYFFLVIYFIMELLNYVVILVVEVWFVYINFILKIIIWKCEIVIMEKLNKYKFSQVIKIYFINQFFFLLNDKNGSFSEFIFLNIIFVFEKILVKFQLKYICKIFYQNFLKQLKFKK